MVNNSKIQKIMLNINVGLLGHVDSGKTTLAKALSEVASTASFDKHPQAQERGITIDLGFSSFKVAAPEHLGNHDVVQFTLVDCPGHASLISTVIGGAQIIDMVLLIVDATKGVQTQTAECMVIAEIICKKMIVVVNKSDLLSTEKHQKILKKMRVTVDSMSFKGCPIVSASGLQGDVHAVTECLLNQAFQPHRDANAPFLMAVDHCFGIQGKGTVLTGTILQGSIQVNEEIEIPAIKAVKKIKSIQMFRQPVNQACQGDRVGVCVTQFDPKLVERGLASKPGVLSPIYAVVVDMKRVRFYGKPIISRKMKFHITIGHETVLASVLMFCDSNTSDFDITAEYRYLDEFDKDTPITNVFALLEFDHPVLIAPDAWIIGAKLDLDLHTNSSCRMAFYGKVRYAVRVKNYKLEILPQLKVFKEKLREGLVERVSDEMTVVGRNMFQKKTTNMAKFFGMRVELSTGETGVIESAFGQSGKFKIRVDGLKKSTADAISKKHDADNAEVKIILKYKRFLFDSQKKILQ